MKKLNGLTESFFLQLKNLQRIIIFCLSEFFNCLEVTYTYKIYWLDSLIKKLKSISKQNENIIIGGDFNIIPSAEDVHNPKSYENDALFRLEIRKKLRELINLGFHDAYRFIHPDKEGYTFWDYTSGAWQKNNGMRIDHFLVSSSLIDAVKDVKINKFPRGRQKPSDHTPIEIELA